MQRARKRNSSKLQKTIIMTNNIFNKGTSEHIPKACEQNLLKKSISVKNTDNPIPEMTYIDKNLRICSVRDNEHISFRYESSNKPKDFYSYYYTGSNNCSIPSFNIDSTADLFSLLNFAISIICTVQHLLHQYKEANAVSLKPTTLLETGVEKRINLKFKHTGIEDQILYYKEIQYESIYNIYKPALASPCNETSDNGYRRPIHATTLSNLLKALPAISYIQTMSKGNRKTLVTTQLEWTSLHYFGIWYFHSIRQGHLIQIILRSINILTLFFIRNNYFILITHTMPNMTIEILFESRHSVFVAYELYSSNYTLASKTFTWRINHRHILHEIKRGNLYSVETAMKSNKLAQRMPKSSIKLLDSLYKDLASNLKNVQTQTKITSRSCGTCTTAENKYFDSKKVNIYAVSTDKPKSSRIEIRQNTKKYTISRWLLNLFRKTKPLTYYLNQFEIDNEYLNETMFTEFCTDSNVYLSGLPLYGNTSYVKFLKCLGFSLMHILFNMNV